MSNDATLHIAADLVQRVAQEGRVALYIESKTEGDFRIIMADGSMKAYAELLYAAADRVAEQTHNPHGQIYLRD